MRDLRPHPRGACVRGLDSARPAPAVSFPAVNAFHVIGGLLAIWALLVSFLGITRENFPATKTAERIVATISAVLVLAAISAAIITSATEEEDEEGGHEEAALVVPR